MNIKSLALASLIAIAAAPAAHASHASNIGTIDTIDAHIAAGGGSWTGSLANGLDDAWVVFYASAGDALTIGIDAQVYKNAVLLKNRANNGFAVGDVLDIDNFNITHVGEGDDLEVLAHIGPLEFGGSVALNWTALYSGEYAVAIGAANGDNFWAGGPMTVRVSGNTSEAAANGVPEPSTLAIAALGLFGVGAGRLRKR